MRYPVPYDATFEVQPLDWGTSIGIAMYWSVKGTNHAQAVSASSASQLTIAEAKDRLLFDFWRYRGAA